MEDLTKKVLSSMRHAIENGYDLSRLSPGQVAVDLMQYDADLENEYFDDVAQAVHSIRVLGLLNDNGVD